MLAPIRFAVGGAVVAIVLLYLAFSAASSSWQYYLTVDECLSQSAALRGARLRVSGTIAADSLHVTRDRSLATFSMVGANGRLPVECPGPLPDNLAAASDVVVEGQLEPSGRLRGERIMTRCASKYRAREREHAAPGAQGAARVARRSSG